ncbi:MAG: lysyl oxidase family protein [Pseudomonadota bacterium]
MTSRTNLRIQLPFVVLCLALTLTTAPAQAHSRSAPKSLLSLDDSTFWDGGTILTTKVPDPELCGVLAPCPEFELNIVGGARRLRVGIDTPERSDTFAIELINPSGTVVATETNSNQFNSEAMVLDPVEGKWTIRIRPEDVTDASFRLRAKLESILPEELPRAPGHLPLLPNLRTVPPLEFTFTAPANPLNGVYPPDTVNPPLSVAGFSPISCTVDESAPPELGGGNAKHCLRFTSGPMNLGPGIYDMRFRMIDDFIAGTAKLNPAEALSRIVVGPMEQVIYYTDDTTETVTAGTYSFHPVHAHFHDDYVLSFELYKVTDYQRGGLERAGEGTKSGFCPADQLFADWFNFGQGYEVPGGDTAFGNCFSPTDGVIGLSVGWGDVYRWQRPGMFVEFDGQGNGRYVVRSFVDANNHVLETNDTDNVSYAYIEIQGENIDIIERGWGSDPWDPLKVVFDGTGPAQRLAPDAPATSLASEVKSKASGLFLGAIPTLTLLLFGLSLFIRHKQSPLA